MYCGPGVYRGPPEVYRGPCMKITCLNRPITYTRAVSLWQLSYLFSLNGPKSQVFFLRKFIVTRMRVSSLEFQFHQDLWNAELAYCEMFNCFVKLPAGDRRTDKHRVLAYYGACTVKPKFHYAVQLASRSQTSSRPNSITLSSLRPAREQVCDQLASC